MQPFNARAPAGHRAGEFDLVVIGDVIEGVVFRHAEGSEFVPDGFRAVAEGGGGQRVLDARFLELAQDVGVLVDGGGHFQTQLVKQGGVDVPSAVVVDVLGDQVADVVAVTVRSGDGVARVVEVQAGDVVGHDVLGDVLIQRHQQALIHAVVLNVGAATQNHVHVLAGDEHQVQLRLEVAVLHHGEVNVRVGLFFNLLEEPEIVEVRGLVFQRVLEGRQVDLVFRHRRADERQRQSQCEENRDDFLHRENLLSFVPFSRGERHGIDSSRRCGRVKSEKNGEPKGSRGRSESPLVAPAGAKSPCHKSALQ